VDDDTRSVIRDVVLAETTGSYKLVVTTATAFLGATVALMDARLECDLVMPARGRGRYGPLLRENLHTARWAWYTGGMPTGYAKQGTPGQRKRAIALLRLLRDEVGPLLPAERRLARAVVLGEMLVVPERTGDARFDPQENEERWRTWGEHRVVRAEVIRTLCMHEMAQRLVDPKGIGLIQARITGTLDLMSAQIPHDIFFERCGFEHEIDAYNARLANLGLSGCRAPGLNADRLECRRGVFLRGGFQATGEVRLLGAQLGGNLDCSGGRFDRPGGPALSADGLECRGGVFLRGGFQATGEVRLLGAKLGGDLDCSGGRFDRPGGPALSADGLECRGGVFLRGGFQATGEVRLLGAKLGGDLSLEGGHFEHPGDDALDASYVEVTGTLLLRRATFDGRLVLTQSRVGLLNDQPLLYRLDRTPEWPARIVLNDFCYDAIHTRSPLNAVSRLAWLANHDRTMGHLRETPPAAPSGIVLRMLVRFLPHNREGYWSRHATPPDPQPYRQLADVLRQQGHDGDASAVLRALGWRRMMPMFRQRLRQSRKDRLWAAPLFVFSLLQGVVVGHGHARFRPLYWLLVLWLIGAVIFAHGDGRVMIPAERSSQRAWTTAQAQGFSGSPMQPRLLAAWANINLNSITDEHRAMYDYPAFNPVVYSLDTLLPLIDFGLLPPVDFQQQEYWMPRNGPGWIREWPTEHGRPAWWWRLRFPSAEWWIKAVYLPAHIAMGWIVATLFAASFTRLARRE